MAKKTHHKVHHRGGMTLAKLLAKHYHQKGHSHTHSDSLRRAKHAGWRISKTGHLYFENRANRSDRHTGRSVRIGKRL